MIPRHRILFMGDVQTCTRYLPFARNLLYHASITGQRVTEKRYEDASLIRVMLERDGVSTIYIEAGAGGYYFQLRSGSSVSGANGKAFTALYKNAPFSQDAIYGSIKRAQLSEPPNIIPDRLMQSYHYDTAKNEMGVLWRGLQNSDARYGSNFPNEIFTESLQAGKTNIDVTGWAPFDAKKIGGFVYSILSFSRIGIVFSATSSNPSLNTQIIKVSRHSGATETIGAVITINRDAATKRMKIHVESEDSSVLSAQSLMPALPGPVTINSTVYTPEYFTLGAIDAKLSANGMECSILIHALWTFSESYESVSGAVTDAYFTQVRDIYDLVLKFSEGSVSNYCIPNLSAVTVVSNGVYDPGSTDPCLVNVFTKQAATLEDRTTTEITNVTSPWNYNAGANPSPDVSFIFYAVHMLVSTGPPPLIIEHFYIATTNFQEGLDFINGFVPAEFPATGLGNGSVSQGNVTWGWEYTEGKWDVDRGNVTGNYKHEFIGSGIEYSGYKYSETTRQFIELLWCNPLSINTSGKVNRPLSDIKMAVIGDFDHDHATSAISIQVIQQSTNPDIVPLYNAQAAPAFDALALQRTTSISADGTTGVEAMRLGFFVGQDLLGFACSDMLVLPFGNSYSLIKEYKARRIPNITGITSAGNIHEAYYADRHEQTATLGSVIYNGVRWSGNVCTAKENPTVEMAQYTQFNCGSSGIFGTHSWDGMVPAAIPNTGNLSSIGVSTPNFENNIAYELVKDGIHQSISGVVNAKTQASSPNFISTSVIEVSPTTYFAFTGVQDVTPPIHTDPAVAAGTIYKKRIEKTGLKIGRQSYGIVAPIHNDILAATFSFESSLINQTNYPSQFSTNTGRNKIIIIEGGIVTVVPELQAAVDLRDKSVLGGIGFINN
jgi:hypothetical protein